MDLKGLTEYFSGTPEFSRIRALPGSRITVGGLNGGGRGVFLSSLLSRSKAPILAVTSSATEADDLSRDIAAFCGQDKALYYPPLDIFPFEDVSPDKEVVSQRLKVLDRLIDGGPVVIVAPIRAVAERTLPREALKANRLLLKAGRKADMAAIVKKLVEMGYSRQLIVGERGELAVRGGLIDIFTSSHEYPLRVEFIGDTIESIRMFDTLTQTSIGALANAVTILPVREMIINEALKDAARILKQKDDGIMKIIDGVYFDGMEYYSAYLDGKTENITSYLPDGAVVFIDDRLGIENSLNKLIKESSQIKGSEIFKPGRLELKGRNYPDMKDVEAALSGSAVIERGQNDDQNLKMADPASYYGKIDDFIDSLKSSSKNSSVFIVSKQATRLHELISGAGIPAKKIETVGSPLQNGVHVTFGELTSGFSHINVTVYTDKELFSVLRQRERYSASPKEGVSTKLLADLGIGDYVVHVNHGIGVYRGLEKLKIGDAEQEYIEIEYAEGDKLYVPLHLMSMVQKYSSLGDYRPKVNRLGGTEWIKTKAKAKKSIKDMTNELIEIYSARKRLKKSPLPQDSLWQAELEQSFQHEETPDQQKAVSDVKRDMESDKPMDRLVCGDVGYGKTEVAIRAAFKTASSGKQVAVLVPTTVLAEQHFRNFSGRFKPFPVVVEMLSRFRSKDQQKVIMNDLANGAIDVVIGTHRLLQDDVKFKDLELLIVDEEQRFGVAHKEKIKKLKTAVDVLTLTATPIPRTLYMSLSGARDMSMINTPPLDRSPIKTYLYEWNEGVIHEAILREIERGGQVYFVYNIVKDIDRVAAMIKRLIPTVRVAVAHGQMEEKGLEAVMVDFLNKKYDVLVCSTIIESGLDIASVNTIIIDHAERLGLAQLYQLRGRVGRSSTRAYAYLLYHKEDVLTDQALERLKAIQEFTALGSGYKLAMRDLEIRGAGNILGAEQHGHIVSIGFDLYCELLDEAVKEIKHLPEEVSRKTYIDLKLNAFIPQEYVQDDKQRIALYRRMNFINDDRELKQLIGELEDRFGRIPKELDSLLDMIKLKLEASKKDIASLEGGPSMVKIMFRKPYNREKIEGLGLDITALEKTIKLRTSGMTRGEWFRVVREIVRLA